MSGFLLSLRRSGSWESGRVSGMWGGRWVVLEGVVCSIGVPGAWGGVRDEDGERWCPLRPPLLLLSLAGPLLEECSCSLSASRSPQGRLAGGPPSPASKVPLVKLSEGRTSKVRKSSRNSASDTQVRSDGRKLFKNLPKKRMKTTEQGQDINLIKIEVSIAVSYLKKENSNGKK